MKTTLGSILACSLLTSAVFEAAVAERKEAKLKMIPLAQIRPNPVALRDVDQSTEDFASLVMSIQQAGVINSISVREKTDAETKVKYYEIMDGLHRWTASNAAGLELIPAQILDRDESETMELQMIANLHTIETTPAQYSNQLMRYLKSNVTMTEANLATKLGKSTQWLSERLGLTKLEPTIAKLVDEGKIALSSAYALAKLPREEQLNWSDRAQTMNQTEFVSQALARKKEMDAAVRAGRAVEEEKFNPTPHLQKLVDIKSELENPTALAALITTIPHGPNAALEGAKMAIRWILNTDPKSLAAREQDWNDRNAQRKAEKDEKAKIRAQKKADQQTAEAKAVKAEQDKIAKSA